MEEGAQHTLTEAKCKFLLALKYHCDNSGLMQFHTCSYHPTLLPPDGALVAQVASGADRQASLF